MDNKPTLENMVIICFTARTSLVHLEGGASLMVNTLSTIDAHKLIACKLNYGQVSIASNRQRFIPAH